MSLATAPTPCFEQADLLEAEAQPDRMPLEVYLKIAELGLIRREEHVVLLDGILVRPTTKGPQHINAVDRGEDALKAGVPGGWLVRDEAPVVLREGPIGTSVPEPDLVVLFGTRERYENRHPEVAEIALVVEVASSVTAFAADRRGLARYAFVNIPTVWIVTLHDCKIHVYTEPSGPTSTPGYARVEVKQWGELLEASLMPPVPDLPPAILGPIAVASFFPPTA